jgi:endonuclease YncB( thermonuclease family)
VNLLLELRQKLQTLYLQANSVGQRVRIDAMLATVEEKLAEQERHRLQRRIQELPARLQTQAALLAELQRVQQQGAWIEEGHVKRVIDGDTILLSDGERVRYLGMDAPELNNGPGKSATPEPFSRWATAANVKLVEGKTVRLLRDRSERDRYGRLLRYVFCSGTFVNAQLLLEGAARLYLLPPDLNLAELLARAELHAQRRQVGLWGKIQQS